MDHGKLTFRLAYDVISVAAFSKFHLFIIEPIIKSLTLRGKETFIQTCLTARNYSASPCNIAACLTVN